ncbi:MAG: GNAT family N-acetyltransferase, partial [Planctomycetaceae bacterium]|nr:GNAT family N-acetyltransferase [Planctomycetaceae bacterium]
SDEHRLFEKTLSIPFGMDPSPGLTARFQIALDQATLSATFEGDQMVSTFGSYDLNLTVPGGVGVPSAGTTLVTVLPTHRRQGILRAHMREHFQEAQAKGQHLAALWASESCIYGRFGYGPAAERSSITIEKPYAKLQKSPKIQGTMRLVDEEEALKVFPPIYEGVATQRAGMFTRASDWWKVRNLADPEDLRRGATSHRRVVHYRDGQPVGYSIYRTLTDYNAYTTELRISELIAQDTEAEKALWEYLFGVDLVAKITHWNLPPHDPLFWWLERPRELDRHPSDSIWVRPLNVVEAFNRRHYPVDGRLVFRYQDELCPWNEGVYELQTSADEPGDCRESSASTELELTPFSLGAVYLGGHRVGALARAGLIQGSPEAIQRADAMFRWHTEPWCQEIF